MAVKNKKFYFVIILLAVILAGAGIYNFKDQIFVQTQKSSNSENVVVSIMGNVETPGKFVFVKGTTLREALKTVGVKSFSNIGTYNLDDVLIDNHSYLITEEKFNRKNFSDVDAEFLKSIKVNTKQAEVLLEYKSEKDKAKWSWEDIEKLSGIGPITLRKLQERINLK